MIIAFCGERGSGKDTAANMFAEIFKDLYKGETEKVAFAGPLKVICSKVFNIDMKYFMDIDLKEKEMDSFISLTEDSIIEIFKEFGVTSWTYNEHIRPHIGQVFETPRRLLQYVGTDLLHPIDKLIHIKKALAQRDSGKISLITDLRFLQEFMELKKSPELLTVNIYRPLTVYSKSEFSNHASETGVQSIGPMCDVQLSNGGTLDELRVSLTNIINTKVIR